MSKISQCGRTMLETIMAMAVIGTIVASILSLIHNVLGQYKSNQILSEIRDMRKRINHGYSVFGVYTDLSIPVVVKERMAPPRMISQGKVYNSFLGEVSVSPAHNGGKNHSFKISFPKIPKKSCIDLAMIDWNIERAANLVSIQINQTTYKWSINKVGQTTTSNKTLPMSVPKAFTSCSSEKDNTITWEFQ